MRREVGTLEDELRELTDSVHRDEVARTQQRLRIETLQAKAVEELGIDPDVLVEDFGPHQLVPRRARPRDDAEEAERAAARAVRARGAGEAAAQGRARAEPLGRVNPLALEEFAALEERHKFLTEQLEDLKNSKRDLLDIVREVDERVEQVFTEAFHDTAAQFERRLRAALPRRRGPARRSPTRTTCSPPASRSRRGRRARRSSGSRCSPVASGRWSRWRCWWRSSRRGPARSTSWTRSRPRSTTPTSGRLITLFEELRDSSQLIVITHQKRTMEIADALYGVTMRGDGVTTVVSQRIRDVQSA